MYYCVPGMGHSGEINIDQACKPGGPFANGQEDQRVYRERSEFSIWDSLKKESPDEFWTADETWGPYERRAA